MLKGFLDRVHPAFCTSRRDYWIFCCVYFVIEIMECAAFHYLAFPVPSIARDVLISAVLGLSFVFLLVTIRRLRDAGFSPWWAVLFFFPIQISWDLFSARFGPVIVKGIEFQGLIVLIPIAIGLLKPARQEAAVIN